MIKRFISALGGVGAVAAALSCAEKRVYSWIERDTIPFRHRPAVLALAASKKIQVPKELAQWARAA